MDNNPRKIVREKAQVCGLESLSDSELLLLATDDITPADVDSLLERFGGLGGVCSAELRELRKAPELGAKGAMSIATGVELGRRAAELRGTNIEFVTSSDDIKRMFASLATLAYEEFWVVYLNTAGRVLERLRVSQGGVSSTQVDTRLVAKRAVELLSSSVVLVHNHPSGMATASDSDRELTRKIAQALALFDVRVVDHVIISSHDTLSFASTGLL